MTTNLEDEPDLALQAAKKRLSKPHSFLSLPKLRNSPSSSSALSKRRRSPSPSPAEDTDTEEEDVSQFTLQSSEQHPVVTRLPSIRMDDSLLARQLSTYHCIDAEFKWAVIYENQRGITIFSIPYYSRLALLPTDPYPFTAPSSVPITRRSANSNLSLHTYPLPSGDWRWVSKAWMIDMRSADEGQVAHDGFEYNAFGFRQHGWRARTNTFAWVRRRRWVRLMYRPAKPTTAIPDSLDNTSGIPGTPKTISSLFTSSILSELDSSLPDPFTISVNQVFLGDNVKSDYIRCSALMKQAGRDGKKIELWETWLGLRGEGSNEAASQHSRGDADVVVDDKLLSPMTSKGTDGEVSEEPPPKLGPLEAIAQVWRQYGSDILHSFAYPASRARLVTILAQRDPKLLEMNHSIRDGSLSNDVEFWSYHLNGGYNSDSS